MVKNTPHDENRTPPDDFASAETETAFYSQLTNQPEKEREILTPKEFVDRLNKTFYLDQNLVEQEPKLTPQNIGIWAELSGPSGSGKHETAFEIEKWLASRMPDNQLVNERMITHWIESGNTIKNQIASERARVYQGEKTYAELTGIEYLSYMLKLSEFTRQHPSEKTNVVTTWGALSTWNLMADHYSKGAFQKFIREQSLKTALWEMDSITHLSNSLTQEQVQQVAEIMTGVSSKIRDESTLNLCPLIDTSRGFLFISGLSLEACERNRQNQIGVREIPRRWDRLSDELQMQIRLVDAVMLTLCPDTVIAINEIQDTNFAQTASKRVVEKSLEVLEKYQKS